MIWGYPCFWKHPYISQGTIGCNHGIYYVLYWFLGIITHTHYIGRAYIGISHGGTLVGVHPTIPWISACHDASITSYLEFGCNLHNSGLIDEYMSLGVVSWFWLMCVKDICNLFIYIYIYMHGLKIWCYHIRVFIMKLLKWKTNGNSQKIPRKSQKES